MTRSRQRTLAILTVLMPWAALAQTIPDAPAAPSRPVATLPPAAPLVAPAPAVVTTLPPIPTPQLSAAQFETLVKWLGEVAANGLAGDNPVVTPVSLENDALVAAVLDRARAVHAGRLANSDFLEVWAMRPAAFDPLPSFAAAVAGDRIAQWIGGLTPPYAGYEGLRKGLIAYRTIKANGGWSAIPAGAELAMGQAGPRVAALRARLLVEDAAVPAAGKGFDAALRDAVQRAQRRYGLNPTGSAGAQTLAALNVSVDDRIGAIMANMERWRWLPRELPKHRVQVNIAAAVLTVFEGDAPVASMRAVTGSPNGHETPMLASSIHSIVVNPPWNVPTKIADTELWPAEKRKPGYLAARGFRIIETPEGGKRLQQAAGETSALGRLKFDFANDFAVYLHDTPSRAKFASFDRLASHGCVRLEKPLELANRMLQNSPKWSGTAVQTAIDAGATVRVPLPEQVAVYLFYWSAFASANGQMNFRGDPYSWDRVLAAKIEASSKRAAVTSVAINNVPGEKR